MARVSSMGTPAFTSSPMVCRRRVMYRARNIFLNSGTVSLVLSHQSRPHWVWMMVQKLHAPPIAPASSRYQ